jgi:hypothetical protein
MRFDSQTLYDLLPAVYRIQDVKQGGVLRELLRVITEQVAALEEDLDQLYDDQFIETCADWVIPYIGDLIGYQDLHRVSSKLGTSRAEVANTIGYRRRKGTAAMLEQLARDVTGWDAVVVEFFQYLATTQYMNHVRLNHRVSAEIGHREALADINSPFDQLAHTLDVRRIASRRGYYNIPNIGIFLWRLQSYPLSESPLTEVDARRFRFHPLGIDMALYNRPTSETAISHMATRANVPAELKRRYLAKHLHNHYGESKSFWIIQNDTPIDIGQISICSLADTGTDQWDNMPNTGVAVDPELGRIAFAADQDPVANPLKSSFRFGFSADLGGGEYDRSSSLAVASQPALVPEAHSTIQGAIEATAGSGVVEIVGSGRYQESLEIAAAQDSLMGIRAANKSRPTVVLSNELIISGEDSAEVTLNGLLITEAQIRVPQQVNATPNRLQRLSLRHCTLVPGIKLASNGTPQQAGTPNLVVETGDTIVEIDSCIIGALQVDGHASIYVHNSIIDATSIQGVAFSAGGVSPGGRLEIKNSTVIGTTFTQEISLASNTLFLGEVKAEKIQQGCVRFSYLPLESRAPRRYRCQPKLDDPCLSGRPQFSSLRYAEPDYCQLLPYCCAEIRQGSDDESEMGAFHDLFQAKRETNLRIRLEEYLRFGLEAGIIYAS